MINVERHFGERRLSSPFSWRWSAQDEMLKSVDLPKQRQGAGFGSMPLPKGPGYHLGLSLPSGWAPSPACSPGKAICNPALRIFRHTLLITSLHLLMVCLYPFVLVSALSFRFNSSFPSPLLCLNLLMCNNPLLFFSLQFCLAKKAKLLTRLL